MSASITPTPQTQPLQPPLQQTLTCNAHISTTFQTRPPQPPQQPLLTCSACPYLMLTCNGCRLNNDPGRAGGRPTTSQTQTAQPHLQALLACGAYAKVPNPASPVNAAIQRARHHNIPTPASPTTSPRMLTCDVCRLSKGPGRPERPRSSQGTHRGTSSRATSRRGSSCPEGGGKLPSAGLTSLQAR